MDTIAVFDHQRRRRVDARVWFSDDDHYAPALGIAASVAAGVVRIDGHARVAETRVVRGIFTSLLGADEVSTPIARYPVFHTAGGEFGDLQEAAQQRMGELEIEAAYATRSSDEDLMIMDGPLRNRTTIPRAIGYIKRPPGVLPAGKPERCRRQTAVG